MKDEKTWVDWLFWICAILITLTFLFCLTSCETAKNLPRHNDKFPIAAADYAAKHFPFKDSAGPVIIDSFHRADNSNFSNLIDSLYERTLVLSDSLDNYWPKALDSSTTEMGDAFSKILLQYQKENAGLKEVIGRLHNEYQPCKPDTIFLKQTNYEVDGAAIDAANLKYQKAESLRAIAEKAVNEWKSKAQLRWWIIACICLVVGIYGGFRIYKFLKP